MRLRAAVLLLLGAGAAAAAAAPAGAQSVTPPCPRAVDFAQAEFPPNPVIDNTWLPLRPGTRLTLEGRANRGGGPLPHTVSFTTTDITKVINGVNTLVVWDVDINEGELAETELAFFAQDTNGNVWNLGEYPEEYDGGDFVGAPSTWISGLDDAEGGIHMVAQPSVGQTWLQGWVPSIEFLDSGRGHPDEVSRQGSGHRPGRRSGRSGRRDPRTDGCGAARAQGDDGSPRRGDGARSARLLHEQRVRPNSAR